MGAGKFGYPGWHEDSAWKGWWGDEPPFHTPVFVLTHHPRPSIEMKGGTTFHFLDAGRQRRSRRPATRRAARTCASVEVLPWSATSLQPGSSTTRTSWWSRILLGRGVRLWDGLEGLEKDYQVEATSSPSGVTHVTFTRTAL